MVRPVVETGQCGLHCISPGKIEGLGYDGAGEHEDKWRE